MSLWPQEWHGEDLTGVGGKTPRWLVIGVLTAGINGRAPIHIQAKENDQLVLMTQYMVSASGAAAEVNVPAIFIFGDSTADDLGSLVSGAYARRILTGINFATGAPGIFDHIYRIILYASVPAIYVFGDSSTDVGNNNYLPPTAGKANFHHNGIDFPGGVPTGRFCNGYIGVDYLGEISLRMS
ncbi:GDSL esterase/lipase [Acorus gramineus]|uniref:GDSL esterase/lipase n=1 Tax=Acorus gramineus TaxID=55184 RepID=A0AAV9AAQ5_ACOGR|nr:GDSL esterase/lipase [Acorus gramineus]